MHNLRDLMVSQALGKLTLARVAHANGAKPIRHLLTTCQENLAFNLLFEIEKVLSRPNDGNYIALSRIE